MTLPNILPVSRSRFLLILLGLGSCLAFAGCGRPAMVPAQGTITYRGYPVTNGIIVFAPDPDSNRGPLAIGRIREDGSFVLYTGDNPGVYPGTYRMTVSSLAPGSSSESWGRFDFPRSALPDKYRDPEQSGFRPFKVLAGKSNTFDVQLTD